MLAKDQLNDLAERRRLLVMEADLHRSLIGLECESLRGRLGGLQAAREKVVSNTPWLMAGGAVVGLVAVRHWRELSRWLPAALTALRWLQALKNK